MGLVYACASVVALEKGKQVHEQVIQKGCDFDAFNVVNNIVEASLCQIFKNI
jgi:hypothetical protein